MAIGWIGSLAQTPLAEVFRVIALEERSGDLQVTTSSAIKTVYFDRGFVVFASSNLKSERLGESMIEAGRISRHEFAAASTLMRGSKRKFGQALVHAGIVSEEEMGRHVAAQVNRIVLSLFSEKQGMYSFDERPSIIPLELMVSLSVYRILIEGIRRMSSKKLILSGLPALDTEMRIVDSPPFTLDVDKLKPLEKAVVRSARNGASIHEIAKTVGENEGVVLRACYALYAAGVLEPVTFDARSRLRRVQEETGTFMLSEIQQKVGQRPVAGGSLETPEVELSLAPDESPEPPTEMPVTLVPDGEPEPSGEEPAPPSGEDLSVVVVRTWNRARDALEVFARKGWSSLHRLWDGVRSLTRDSISRFRKQDLVTTEIVEPTEGPSRDESLPAPPLADGRAAGEPDVPPVHQGEDRRNEWTASGIQLGSEHPSVESIGIPSWSKLDDPDEVPESDDEKHERKPSNEILEAPSWSMRDAPGDRHEQAPGTEPLGVPIWSMKDGPKDAHKPFPDPRQKAWQETREQEPVTEKVSAPSWSRMSDTNDDEESPIAHMEQESDALDPESTLEFEKVERPSSPPAQVPLVLPEDTDYSDLDLDGDDEQSMLSHIPVEEIKLEEESVEPELEVEIEIEEEPFEDVPAPTDAPPRPAVGDRERVVATSVGETDDIQEVKDVTAPALSTVLPSSSVGDENRPLSSVSQVPDGDEDEDEETAPSETDQAMGANRLKVGGGEKRLLRDVKLHFQFRDWDGAVQLLEQLIQISPGSAFYRGMLGRAMSRHPDLRDHAEKQFIEALRLSPQDPQVHYWLGLYYKSFGLKSRAVNEFRTTLRIDPRHDGARKQLSGGSKRGGDNLGDVIMKLFS